MKIKNLSLKHFRNYENATAEFGPNLNFILGRNAAGKTNIVEAIHYMSLTRSFRTSNETDLIRNNCDFAVIEGTFEIGDETKKIKIVLTKEGKKITCNGYEIKRISELSKIINVIVFKPEDVLMFNDSPGVRRKFMDVAISKMDFTYLRSMLEFEKILKERNELLKHDKVDKTLLEVITDQLIKAQKQIILKRQAFISSLERVVNEIVSSLKGENQTIKINYYPYVKIDDDYLNNASKAYFEALEGDLRRKTTSLGVHREDFRTLLNHKDIATYGSQGEKRLVALSFVLALYFLIDDKEKRPIVILDDVLSELDKNHQRRLIEFLKKIEQVFITTTNYDDEHVNTYFVSNYKITRR